MCYSYDAVDPQPINTEQERKEMNEKVLARGRFSGLNPFSVACYVIAIGALVACFAVAAASAPSVGIMWAFEGISYGYYWFFIGAALFVVLGIVASTGFELVITESTVTGKALFAKRVDLPVSQISAIGTGMFSSVALSTASGAINFYGVINQDEMFKCLSNLLKSRQNATQGSTSNTPVSSLEELAKLKELLDKGIINQEEFEAKKKQLLGL